MLMVKQLVGWMGRRASRCKQLCQVVPCSGIELGAATNAHTMLTPCTAVSQNNMQQVAAKKLAGCRSTSQLRTLPAGSAWA